MKTRLNKTVITAMSPNVSESAAGIAPAAFSAGVVVEGSVFTGYTSKILLLFYMLCITVYGTYTVILLFIRDKFLIFTGKSGKKVL